MTIQERLEAFWTGERPDQIPFTIYEWEWMGVKDDPAWVAMYRQGLGVTHHLMSYRTENKNVQIFDETTKQQGDTIRRQTFKTPVGEIWQTWVNGWHRDYLIKAAQDYRVMTYITRNTVLMPDYETFRAQEQAIQPYGIALLHLERTPLQTILVDYVGLEAFAFHLTDFEEEVRELYAALLEVFRRKVEIVAAGPGRYVANLENFTAESLGPQRYGEFLLPVYEECFPVLHAAGKIVGCHYDGRTECCRELIARAPMDLIESLTEPPEGDQTPTALRKSWPDKLFWSNIRVSDYKLPPEQFRRKIRELVQAYAPDGKRLAFEVSEHRPENWRESMPVVLETLREMSVS